jgi:hypothetical protein
MVSLYAKFWMSNLQEWTQWVELCTSGKNKHMLRVDSLLF